MTSLFNKLCEYSYRENYIRKFFKDRAASKKSKNCEEIIEYILSDRCAEDIKRLSEGDIFFKPPVMKMLPKGDGAYRRVFSYDSKDRALLGMINRALFDSCDYLFSENLYSYRRGISNYDAFKKIRSIEERDKLYAYKADVKAYDACIDGGKLKEMLEEKIDDKEMAAFLCRFIEQDEYIYKGEVCLERQAVKAGSPLTPFFEDLFLTDYDEKIVSLCADYFRVNDDILIYGTKKQTEECEAFTKEFFAEKHLIINEQKSRIFQPGEEITFLGMEIGEDLDISSSAIEDIRRVLTKKARAVLSLKRELCLSDDTAMSLMLKFEQNLYSELLLLFGRVNKTDGIRKIDSIMQDCLRIVGSGKFGRGRYRIRYKALQELGYVPLINIYYQWEWKKKA